MPTDHVCGKCLMNDTLAEFVEDSAIETKCDFCGQEKDSAFAASLDDVIEHIAECVAEEYTDPAEELPYETREGGWQGEVFNGWDLMQEIDFEVESEELLDAVVMSFIDQQWCRRNYFQLEPSERLRYGWEGFKSTVKHTRRFTFWAATDNEDDDPDYTPVGQMLAQIGKRIQDAGLIKEMASGNYIWRVRIHDPEIVLLEDHELSPPPRERATQANRMSPAGVVMFYGAEDFDTACVETVEPQRSNGKRVTGALFRTLREMRILDLVELPSVPSFFELGVSDLRGDLLFLHEFASDLAVPVVRNGREHVEYVPTQAFTEYVRYDPERRFGASVDGVRYRSAINGKPCYVLFCAQDDCIANPQSHRPYKRWLELEKGSIRTEDAQRFASKAAALQRKRAE